MDRQHTVIVGAGMAGLAAAIALSSRGEKVTLLEKQAYPGGKMRLQNAGNLALDAGPTVFTMKWVFDSLFDMANSSVEREITLKKADILARHAWGNDGFFDLFAEKARSEEEISRFFDQENARGYRRFCADSRAIFETLKDTFIAAPRPSPLQFVRRVGVTNFSKLLELRPFHTLWRALGDYFPDPRLRQLFGRYATYVGSAPFSAPATLMLIAHVEQEGVWLVDGGMHELALAMARRAAACGAEIRHDTAVKRIVVDGGKANGVEIENGDRIAATRVLYCGDISRLANGFLSTGAIAPTPVPGHERSLSAITWSVAACVNGMALKRHNVFFSDDYRREFDRIFRQGEVPDKPTVYVCAQDREKDDAVCDGKQERLLCLINAPAFGDRRRLNEEELSVCEEQTFSRLEQCGLHVDRASAQMAVTQPADFETLFPGSGGALYGRASHGWTASFKRPGAKTGISGLYLAGGSVHPGAGVPLATLSGMLAAEQIIADRGSI